MKTTYTLILCFFCFTSFSQPINKYDGVYLIKSYTLRGGDPVRTGYPAPYEMNLVTTSDTTVQFDNTQVWPDGSSIGVGNIILSIDSTTNLVTPSSTFVGTGLTVSPVQGYNNYYDASAKIFYVSYTWYTGPTFRLVIDTLIYLRPRDVLPLKLITFKAILSGNETHLTWTTLNEVAVKDYTIERSVDGRLFNAIGSKKASNLPETDYAFYDKNPFKGINYYRLKTTDINGYYKYSKVVTINYHNDVSLEIYPNPAINNLIVKHKIAKTSAFITLINADGKVKQMIPVQRGALQTEVLVDQLDKGNYIIIYQNADEKSVVKFVKE